MGVRDWISEKLNKTVQSAVVEPVKQNVIEIKESTTNKLGLWANLLRVGTCVIIGWLMVKEDKEKTNSAKRLESSQIVINNYIGGNECEQCHSASKHQNTVVTRRGN